MSRLVTAELAEWATSVTAADLPPEVVAATQRCLVDHVACVLGGHDVAAGGIARRFIEQSGADGACTVFGSARPVSARDAVFANAAMANALDYDDTLHGHPGATTWPAAFAATEIARGSGADLLAAAAVGYEVTIRCMQRLQPTVPRYRAMWDLGTMQSYGSAAAAASALGRPAAELASAWGVVSGTAPTPLPRKNRDGSVGTRSMLKSSYGWSAAAGVTAVELAELGFEGPAGAFDDNLGFWTAPSDRRPGLADGLGERFAVVDVEHKPYMACRFIHPVLDAAREILRREAVAVGDVLDVVVESHALLADEHHAIYRPLSATDAQFSVPHTVAAMISAGGVLGPDAYQPPALSDPVLQRLADRVRVVVDPEFDAGFPRSQAARVIIKRSGGEPLRAEIRAARGGPELPLTDAELDDKLVTLAGDLLGARPAAELCARLRSIEALPDLTAVARLLRPPDVHRE